MPEAGVCRVTRAPACVKVTGTRRWPLLKLCVTWASPIRTTWDSPFCEVSSICIDCACASLALLRLTIWGRGARAAFPFTVVNR